MKLVHKPLTRWLTNLCATVTLCTVAHASAQQPEYVQHFDPAKGFKSSQANLTEVFLQIAGSLEAYGSPEPYLRHMQAEHKRVSALYQQKTGNVHTGRMPAHMTDAYIDRFIKNWNVLSPALKLDAFAKEVGRCAREGIMGTRLSGTLVVQICNEHQKLVAANMRGESSQHVGFEELRDALKRELEYGKKGVTMIGYDLPRRDAVSYSLVIDDRFQKLFRSIDTAAKPEKAEQIKQAVSGAFLDLGYLAQSELEIAILEWALRQP